MDEFLSTSILADIRGHIGYAPDEVDPEFDKQIIDHINTSIARLAQLGLGKLGDFLVRTGEETWNDYLGEDYQYIYSFAKDFIQLTAKLKFDPPQGGVLKAALDEQLATAEFNVMTAIEEHNIDKEE